MVEKNRLLGVKLEGIAVILKEALGCDVAATTAQKIPLPSMLVAPVGASPVVTRLVLF